MFKLLMLQHLILKTFHNTNQYALKVVFEILSKFALLVLSQNRQHFE